MNNLNTSLIGTGIVAALLLVGGLSSCSTVDSGEVGLFNTQGSISTQVAQPGVHFTMPFVTKIEKMSVQSQRRNGETPIYTSDMQTGDVKFAVTYSLQADEAVRMRKKVGHEWEKRLVPPAVEGSIKTSFGKVTATNAIANRSAIQANILNDLRRKLGARGINVESFELTNIDYSDAFEKSVERAQVATQDAIAARNETVKIREEAVQKEIRSKAEAESIQRQAQAISANPAIVQMRAVEQWNGVLPSSIYGSAPLPFIGGK